MGAHPDRPPPPRPAGRAEVALLAVMALGPTAAAGVYFVALDGRDSAAAVYLASKLVQFALPLWLWARLRPARPHPRATRRDGLLRGTLSGVALALGALAIPALLAAAGLERGVATRISAKLEDFGIATPAAFVAFALAISLLHSALEEYYWRWSLYGALRSWIADPLAATLAAAAFASHHVVVIGQFVRGAGVAGSLLLGLSALAVFVAGLVWSWVYRSTGRIAASWISHVAADLALFWVGARLLWG
ncbi:MAG TPA: CPBP family intramembrane glutamic endopeptidase [Thermoanaerobaculia bacterium]|nr:CPBP family intramembrane glutamic endopeptidase [Thermoanaerobaculia bacterium]